MRKAKLLITLLCLCLGIMPVAAQSVTIVKEMQKNPYANVLVMYKNDFGSFEKPDMSITFPYALIRMHLEGNAHEVKAAKERLTLDMGQLTGVEARVTTYSNQILFLLRAPRHPMIYIDGGDGCDQVLLSNMQQLQPNCLYDCTVQFTLEEDLVPQTTTQAPKRQFFKFRVTPTNAVVTIVENGAQEILPMREGGIASKMLNYGTYHYSIAADKYHTKEGSFTVSATQTEMTVDLLPQFGWLTITGDNTSQGGYVFATNTATGGMVQLGTLPLNNREMSSGVYTLRIQKEKYKDYSTTITIEDGKTTTIRPSLEANFAQVTLTTNEGADIYVDGSRLGTTRWTGTLELGEHSVETRQASHHSAYTNVRITPQSAGQTVTLNNPLPIYGSLIVDGSPADVAVYVDGKKVGTSPLFVSELLIGTHTVRLEKDGYDQQEKTVQIAENQESMLDFTLTKTVAKAPVVPAVPQGGAVETITVKGVSFNLIKVQGGTFTMGATSEQGSDAYSDEKPMHQVTLSDYYIGETEVTQELWQAVMGTTIQEQAKKGSYDTSLYGVGNSYPMYYISWDDCQTFITKLNQLTGKNFRLPTEAEWEYAARGGQKSRGYKYAGSNTLSDVAWYTGNSGSKTHPVKQKQANELGLYDMTGNVWEWCQDWHGSYSSNAQTNPTGPSSGSTRVYRGGGWYNDASSCRVACRDYYSPGYRDNGLGFRVVLLP
ncbi:MAG: PEGA domain-containing protein [Bacteroidales bacterium]|nr:PEGA domain-containing protein [Bacteroidales bacterium]